MAEDLRVELVDRANFLPRLKAKGRDAGPLLERVGSYLVRLAKATFLNQQLGDTKWPARAIPNVMGAVRDLMEGPSVQDKRFAARPALVDTGALQRSITYRVVGRTAVSVGSSLPYAKTHQSGGKSKSLPITSAIKANLAQFLAGSPQHRADLGFLFRTKRVSANVPARPFLGLPPAAQNKIRDMTTAFLAQKGEFRNR